MLEDFRSIGTPEDNYVENLFSNAELCGFVKEGLEKTHGVKIAAIDYDCGDFTFTILAADNAVIDIPKKWEAVSFGCGTITFKLSLYDFQRDYHKIEGRDFYDSASVAVKKVFGSVCSVVSVGNEDKTMFGSGVEVVVQMKKGCRLSFWDKPWVPIRWVQDDLVALELDEEKVKELLEA